jgi:hypothetical protein
MTMLAKGIARLKPINTPADPALLRAIIKAAPKHITPCKYKQLRDPADQCVGFAPD